MFWVVAILLFLHLFGLAFGMGSGIAASRIGPFVGTASENERQSLFKLGRMLGRNAHIGLGTLWVTGLAMVWLEYGSNLGGLSLWFWFKILLVVVYSATVSIGTASFRRFTDGDVAASGRAALMGKINIILGPLIILSAVVAFK